MRVKAAVVAFIFAMLVSLAAATFSINDQDEPLSHDIVSNDTRTLQVVRLTDPQESNDPVNQSELDSNWDSFDWLYNATSGSQEKSGEMTYLADGYYYANFTANITNGFIEYELKSGSQPEVNESEKINEGNLTVEILNNFTKNYTADNEFDLRVNVTDEWNGTWVNQTWMDASFYVTNGSWTSNVIELGNTVENSYHKNFGITFPLKPGDTYIVHSNATGEESKLGTSNLDGSESLIMNTYPAIKGEVAYMNASSGCNNQSFFSKCEYEATVDTGFNVTSASAKSINLTVNLVEKSTGDWHVKEWEKLNESSGLYTGEVELPDVNTTKYEKKYVLRFNASNMQREYLETYNISYKSYSIDSSSSNTAYQGTDYDVKLTFEKPFSFKSLNSSRFENASIDVEKPDNSLLTGFNLSDMDYKSVSGLFKKSVSIPTDATTGGSYEVKVEAFNIYGEKKTHTDGFNVKNTTQTFNHTGDVEMDIDKTGVYTENVTFWNKINSERNLSVEVDDDISDFTTVNNGDNVILPAGGKKEVELEFNITYVEDKSGDITFNDSETNYEDTIDVDLEAPLCLERNESLCLKESGWINVTQDDYSGTNDSVSLQYLGENNTTVTVDVSVSGAVSSHLDVASSFELNSTDDTEEVELDYNATENGTYAGKVSFELDEDTVSIKTALESNAEVAEEPESVKTGLSVPSSLDLGTFSSGKTLVETVKLENTGDAEITGIEASSDTFKVISDVSSIDPGVTKTVSLTFQSVESTSGSVEFSGTSDGETVSASMGVEGSLSQVGTGGESQDDNQTDQPGSGTTTPPGQDSGGSVIPLVGALVAVLLVGFVAYTSIEFEKGDPLYNLLGG